MNNNIRNFIEPGQVLQINNKLRSLGFNFNLKGTKLLNKVIQIVISSNNEFFVLEDILDEVISIYPDFNKMQIRVAIDYSLTHRNEVLSKKNFKSIFGYEYDKNLFVTKEFINEFVYTLYNNL